MTKKKAKAEELNAGQKITAARRGVVTSVTISKYADMLSEVAAQLRTAVEVMDRVQIPEVEIDGATQFDRGIATIKSFRKNVMIALTKAED